MTDPEPGGAPTPPSVSFASDNHAGVDPVVFEALAAANTAAAGAYGADPWSERLEARFRELFDAPVESLLCWGGTGANVTGLASVLSSWQAIISVDSAHIAVDECGAPVRFTGSQLITVPDVDGKLVPEAVEPYLDWLGIQHHAQPRVLSISQVTELGTVYRDDEIAALADLAHRHGLVLHVDGARIANAVAATGSDVRAMLRETGVDVLTFGFTKIGAMYGEAVVFLDPTLARQAHFVRKQAGQLPSKTRFVAAQGLALLEDDRWLHNARVANTAARMLWDGARELPGLELGGEPEANGLFPVLPPDRAHALRDWSFFWPWDPAADRWRWMTSFATTEDDVEAFLAGLRHHLT